MAAYLCGYCRRPFRSAAARLLHELFCDKAPRETK